MAQLKHKKILVVDDEPQVVEMLTCMLGHYYEIIVSALDGSEGVKKYANLKPDLVIMDLYMPGMDGVEAIKKIIAHDKNAKIIVLTAHNNKQLIDLVGKQGILSYIFKPFREDELIDAIKKALGEK